MCYTINRCHFQNIQKLQATKMTISCQLSNIGKMEKRNVLIDLCFCDAICAQNVETQWQKANLLLEFGEWLYCHNFPKGNAQHQVQWAIDILLHLETEQAEGAGTNH